MNRKEIDELRKEARVAFKKKDFGRALSLSEKLAEENVPAAFYRCGLILEKGWLNGKKDLDRALEFYRKLAINWNADEGYLGCVRIMLEKHESEQCDKAVQYCLGAMKGSSKRWAFILLGRVYEEMYDPPEYKLARKAYLKSFSLGSAWALRQYARSLMKSGNFVGGVFMHGVVTVISPFMLLFGGIQVVRRG
ncbi:MAG TPA: hypothetical protein VFL96_13230 [Acidobacteriaceae bacterium]|nr:hypothetical protein [Acidobacteriaceae bacterium]